MSLELFKESVMDQLGARSVVRLNRKKIQSEHVEFMYSCMPPEMKKFLDEACLFADKTGETLHMGTTKAFIASGVGILDQSTKNLIRKVMGCLANQNPREIEITEEGILISPSRYVLHKNAN